MIPGLGMLSLPWRIGIAAGIALTVFLAGLTKGMQYERGKWETAKAKEQASIARELIAWGKANARSALAIADGIAAARQFVSANEVRTRYITREITRVVDASPSLAVPLPAAVRELRAEQAAQSAAIADAARGGQRVRPEAVPAADR
jgi:hypothetical protein